MSDRLWGGSIFVRLPTHTHMQRRRAALTNTAFDPLDLNLRALEIFVQIADNGGMSLTARRLGLTQSAVSQVVANLEQSLGVQLFDRQVRPIALTPSGVVLLDRARTLLQCARDSIHAARAPASAAVPKLTLCLVNSVASSIGAGLIAHVHGIAAHWSVRAGLADTHGHALLCREADIIISTDPLEDEDGLERYEILHEPFVILLPQGYEGEVKLLSGVPARLDMIRYCAHSLIGKQIERHLRRLRVDAPGKIEFDTSGAIMATIAGGLGWGLSTPLCLLQGIPYWQRLKFTPMPEPVLYRKIWVIARKGELGELPEMVATLAAKCMSNVMSDKIADQLPWVMSNIRIAQVGFELPDGETAGTASPCEGAALQGLTIIAAPPSSF
jgi:DNA-binding transcriptional LysR family regulator